MKNKKIYKKLTSDRTLINIAMIGMVMLALDNVWLHTWDLITQVKMLGLINFLMLVGIYTKKKDNEV